MCLVLSRVGVVKSLLEGTMNMRQWDASLCYLQ